jgi:4-hydroxy-3-methylbut-2-enyl diphosphate reductase
MKTFNVPIIYRSPLITAIKNKRREQDKMKKDFKPALLDFGGIQIFLARHFGFCYGVENAIDIAFRTIEENPDRRIFLLSEIIHNPQVNEDLLQRGLRFLQDTHGRQLVPFDELNTEDIIITPAFGTTLEIENQLTRAGIKTEKYNTTCPFVEKVWNRSGQIAADKYTVVIHGKPNHEETRATFSHAVSEGPAVIISDMNEARKLAKFITGDLPTHQFAEQFKGQYSPGFDVNRDLQRIGVINQTTMLATETQAIADFLKQAMINHFDLSTEHVEDRFADTRDTLCYATNDNQSAAAGMLETKADFAIVVGGYNSSNTSHLVDLCEEKLPTYFINNEDKIRSSREILHYDYHTKKEQSVSDYLPTYRPVRILLSSGASCPDALVEGVIRKLVSFIPGQITVEEMMQQI